METLKNSEEILKHRKRFPCLKGAEKSNRIDFLKKRKYIFHTKK